MKKNFIKTMAVALFAMISGNAFAGAPDGFSIEPITVEPGSETAVTVIANFQYDGVSSMGFKIIMPDGFTIKKNKKGTKYVCDKSAFLTEEDMNWSFDLSDKVVNEQNTIYFIASSSDYLEYAGQEFDLCTFTLVADASVEGGEYNLDIIEQQYTVAPEPDEYGENAGVITRPVDYNWVVTVPGAVEEGAKVNISASGRTVYYDEAKSLDFSSLTDVTAWVVVNATASKVYTKQVEKVPAMTAVIVEGPASTEVTIPYTTEEVEAPEANILTPITESFVIDDSNYGKIYILSGGVFKKAKNGLTMPVGKAYFELPEATARIANEELEIVNGEATGIQNVNVENENAPVYNLNGVRVNKLQKGVYIQNGHKFIVK